MLPTPKTLDSRKQRPLVNGKNISQTTGTSFGVHLVQLAEAKMLPTPTTRDANGIENSPSQKGKSRLAADLGDGTTSQLNPHFVEEMMGFPKGWTELPFLNGETKVSKDTETQ
jgi:hypothetical protein